MRVSGSEEKPRRRAPGYRVGRSQLRTLVSYRSATNACSARKVEELVLVGVVGVDMVGAAPKERASYGEMYSNALFWSCTRGSCAPRERLVMFLAEQLVAREELQQPQIQQMGSVWENAQRYILLKLCLPGRIVHLVDNSPGPAFALP